MKVSVWALACLVFSWIGSANAELIGRAPMTPGGNDYQAYYDTLLDVTWAADGGLSYAEHIGFAGCGPNNNLVCYPNYRDLTFGQADLFIQHLNTIEYLGAANWRLPKAEPLNGLYYYPGGNPIWTQFYNGCRDYGYRIAAPGTCYEGSSAHELSHLYYYTLGNLARFEANFSIANINTGPFVNFRGCSYCNGIFITSGRQPSWPSYHLVFHMLGGISDAVSHSWDGYVRPVADGDPLGIVQVAIDIKPEDEPNCFNINGHGVVPVAVLGSPEFDVYEIDQNTLSFGGLDVRVRGNKGPLCSPDDVNLDGYADLVCQFEDNADYWEPGQDDATLTGLLLDGTSIEGTDTICIVP